jgi:hypothetical protein
MTFELKNEVVLTAKEKNPLGFRGWCGLDSGRISDLGGVQAELMTE